MFHPLQRKEEPRPQNIIQDDDEKMMHRNDPEEEGKKMHPGKEALPMVDRPLNAKPMNDTPPFLQKMNEGEDNAMIASKQVEQGISKSKGTGQSLPENIQQELGGKMNADFSGVKVHTDENAVQMNKEVNAKAFTHGNDIYFNNGQYNASSDAGKHLLAHELTHTMQQGKGLQRKIQRKKENNYVLSITKFPWTGIIDTKGVSEVGFHKEPKPSHDDNIWPALVNGQEVKVLSKATDNWLEVSITRDKKTVKGYMDWRYVNLSHNADVAITEKISDAPESASAWNKTFKWNSRFNLLFGADFLKVSVRLYSKAPDTVKYKWAKNIEDKWSKQFKLEAEMDSKKFSFDIIVDVIWVDKESKADQVLKTSAKTTNMVNWSGSDMRDITHEFGHMLGNKEEYFTVDGTQYGAGRQAGKGVMNNPAEDPSPRHFDLVKSEAAKALGINQNKCKIK